MIFPLPDQDPRRQLGELIRRCRVEFDLSHNDLGRRIGASVDRVKAIEAGEAAPLGKEWPRLKGAFRRLSAAGQLWRAAVDAEPTVDGIEEAFEAKTIDENGTFDSIGIPEPVGNPVGELPPLRDPRLASSFGQALAWARVNAGLAQVEMGELLGVEQGSVSRWECGKATPIRDHYEALLDLLPELRGVHEPATLDIDKPDGGLGRPGGPGRPPGVPQPAAVATVGRGQLGGPIAIPPPPPPAVGRQELPALSPLEAAGILLAIARRGLHEATGKIAAAAAALETAQEARAAAYVKLEEAEAYLDKVVRGG